MCFFIDGADFFFASVGFSVLLASGDLRWVDFAFLGRGGGVATLGALIPGHCCGVSDFGVGGLSTRQGFCSFSSCGLWVFFDVLAPSYLVLNKYHASFGVAHIHSDVQSTGVANFHR